MGGIRTDGQAAVGGGHRPLAAGTGIVLTVLLLVGSLAGTAGAATVEARFETSGAAVVGEPISFFDRSSGEPAWVYWNFGDGRSARDPNTSHTYAAAGVYQVRYTVCATPADCDTAAQSVAVQGPTETTPLPATDPVARFAVAGPLVAGAPVTFTDRSSGELAWVYWNFGDGSSSRTMDRTTHTFASPGTYNVRYSVCVVANRCDVQVQTVVVEAATSSSGGGDASLIANFDVRGTGDDGPATVANEPIEFSNRSSGEVKWVYWNFGDGASSRALVATHTYAKPGRYQVRFSVCAASDRCDTATRSVDVTAGSTTGPTTPSAGDSGDSAGAGDEPIDASDPPTALVTSTVLAGLPVSHLSTMAWSPDGRLLAIAYFNGRANTIQVWDRSDPTRPAFEVVASTEPVLAISWGPNSRRLASSSRERGTRIWDLDRLASPIVLGDVGRSFGALAWSPDGMRLVTAAEPSFGLPRGAQVWNLNRPMEPEAFLEHNSTAAEAAWSADGSRLLTWWYDGVVKVWDVDDLSEPIAVMRDPATIIYDAIWSPDATKVATIGSDHVVRVWDVANPTEPVKLRGHAGVVRSIDWSPDGSRIATASRDRTVRLWNPTAAGDPLVLDVYTESVGAVAWSPDGTILATADDTGTVRLFDGADPVEPAEFAGHTGRVDELQWSPDGSTFATISSADDLARLWTVG